MVIGDFGFVEIHDGLFLALVPFGVYPNLIDWPNLPSNITSPINGCICDIVSSEKNPAPNPEVFTADGGLFTFCEVKLFNFDTFWQ